MHRRDLLRLGAAGLAGCAIPDIGGPRGRPRPPLAVQSGDVDADRAIVWARAADPARLLVRWRDGGGGDRRAVGPWLDEDSDGCGSLELAGLPPGEVAYEIVLEDEQGRRSQPATGHFRVRGAGEPFALAWSGDVCGQGWGIAPDRGGIAAFAAVARARPDLFLHSGDAIYADIPLVERVPLPGGGVWRNLMTPAKAKVAESQADFWGNFAYNLLDETYRAFLAEVAVVAQWDDHETENNWYPGKPGADVLARRARRAFLDYAPLRRAGDRIHRALRPHPEVEVIVVDARSFRGDTAMLGAAQAAWLVERLAGSTATWKIVASDQPLGLVIPDGARQDGLADGAPGAPGGREAELAGILAALRARGTRNVVWLTADVHYAAAHHYDPERAAFTDFDPFWELVAGPLHAGVFGPNRLDATFGPEIVFQRAPPAHLHSSGPVGGLMSFGMVRFDPQSRALAVALHGGDGETLWSAELPPT